jgi:hypothetical protein
MRQSFAWAGAGQGAHAGPPLPRSERTPARAASGAPREGGLTCATNPRGARHNSTPMLVATGESIGFGGGGAPDPGAQWLVGLSEMGGPSRLLDPVMKWAIPCAPPTTGRYIPWRAPDGDAPFDLWAGLWAAS